MAWRIFNSAQLSRAFAVLIIALAAIGLHHTDWFVLINGKLLDAGFLTVEVLEQGLIDGSADGRSNRMPA